MSDDRTPQYAGDLHGKGDGTVRRNRRSWARWIWGMVTVGVVFGLLIVGIIKFVNDPVTATGSTTLEQVKATPTPTPPTVNHFAGKTIQFSYSGVFDTVAALSNDHQALDQYTITSKAEYRRSIAIDVRPLGSDNIDDDGSYRVRAMHPEDYTPTSVKLGNETGVVMVKSDGTERTLFWAHDDNLAAISISSNAPNDPIEDYMKTVIATIGWRQ